MTRPARLRTRARDDSKRASLVPFSSRTVHGATTIYHPNLGTRGGDRQTATGPGVRTRHQSRTPSRHLSLRGYASGQAGRLTAEFADHAREAPDGLGDLVRRLDTEAEAHPV